MQKRELHRYKIGIKQIIINHLTENINIYLKVFVIFAIGICIGIFAVNQLAEINLQQINNYITNSISSLKANTEISKIQILKLSLFKNIILVLVIWLFGLSLLGEFILYLITLFVGITFGYSLAAIMTSFTFVQGILFFLTGMLLQNIINIPSILFLIAHGIKSHKSFIDRQKSTLKYTVVKHSMYSFGVLILLVISSLIETYISGNLIFKIVKYL